jgi:hypothetical protein
VAGESGTVDSQLNHTMSTHLRGNAGILRGRHRKTIADMPKRAMPRFCLESDMQHGLTTRMSRGSALLRG